MKLENNIYLCRISNVILTNKSTFFLPLSAILYIFKLEAKLEKSASI